MLEMAQHKPIWANGDLLLRAAAWFFVLAGSFANFLNYHNYPAATVEVAIAAGVGICIAMLLSLAHWAAMPRLSFAITGLLTGLALDLNHRGGWELVLGVSGAAVAVAYFLDRIALKLLCAAFIGVVLFQIPQLSWSTPHQRIVLKHLPSAPRIPTPIVHIVLDAYMGVEGMRENGMAFSELLPLNEDYFLDRGFRLFGGAYSEHRNTVNSLPAIFSFGLGALSTESGRDGRDPPAPLEYFMRLDRLGYRTHLLGSDLVDLCSRQPVTTCVSRPYADLSTLARTPLSAPNRAQAIGVSFFGMGRISGAISQFARRVLFGKRSEETARLLPSLTALELIEALEPKLMQVRNGEAYVAHFILPHDPYVLDRECGLRPQGEWTTETAAVPRTEKEEGYRNHLRCALAKLDQLLTALEHSPAGRDAIVIVHGDHGSRLADHPPRIGTQGITRRDFAMTYSTLFAIRAPRIPSGYDSSPAPVSYLLDELSASNFRRLPSPYQGSRHVFLADREWVPRKKVALPPFGLTTN